MQRPGRHPERAERVRWITCGDNRGAPCWRRTGSFDSAPAAFRSGSTIPAGHPLSKTCPAARSAGAAAGRCPRSGRPPPARGAPTAADVVARREQRQPAGSARGAGRGRDPRLGPRVARQLVQTPAVGMAREQDIAILGRAPSFTVSAASCCMALRVQHLDERADARAQLFGVVVGVVGLQAQGTGCPPRQARPPAAPSPRRRVCRT